MKWLDLKTGKITTERGMGELGPTQTIAVDKEAIEADKTTYEIVQKEISQSGWEFKLPSKKKLGIK